MNYLEENDYSKKFTEEYVDSMSEKELKKYNQSILPNQMKASWSAGIGISILLALMAFLA